MQTTEFLYNTDLAQNSNGYVDVLYYRMAPYANTAGVVAGINTLMTAIVSERNNVHTLLADGVTDVAPTAVANGSADDKGKMLFICKQMIDCIEASVCWEHGMDTDPTIGWLSISPVPAPAPVGYLPKQFRSFVNPITSARYGYTANTRTRRLATIDAAYALYALVNALA